MFIKEEIRLNLESANKININSLCTILENIDSRNIDSFYIPCGMSFDIVFECLNKLKYTYDKDYFYENLEVVDWALEVITVNNNKIIFSGNLRFGEVDICIDLLNGKFSPNPIRRNLVLTTLWRNKCSGLNDGKLIDKILKNN